MRVWMARRYQLVRIQRPCGVWARWWSFVRRPIAETTDRWRTTRAQRASRARGKALRWGRLTVIERAGSDQSHGRDQSLALWRCVCSNHVAAGARQVFVKCDSVTRCLEVVS